MTTLKIVPEKSVKETPLTQDEVRSYAHARYDVTTVIPLAEQAVLREQRLTQPELDRFLEGYHEYAEFIVKVERVSSAVGA